MGIRTGGAGMELGPSSKVLVFGAVGWTCFFCLQGALNWTRQNRPQYLFFVRYGHTRPTRHPQEAKIQQMRAKFDLAALQATLACEKPTPCCSLDDLDFAWVGRKRDLKALAKLLQSCKVFAVDLEAHSVFTYQAMPCLLQIAVGCRCFVVDLLALHDCISILKAPFEDAQVLKLLHGSAADIKWLQQLDIYPINVLDTCALAEEAVRINRVKKPGLGALLNELCGVDSNKGLAAGDWRKRPLSKEMLLYSVLDVHYLQYIAMTLVGLCLEDQGQSTAAVSSKVDHACTERPESEQKQQLEGPDASPTEQGDAEGATSVPGSGGDRNEGDNGLLEDLVAMNSAPPGPVAPFNTGTGSISEGMVAPLHAGSMAMEGPHDDGAGTPASHIDREASLELKTGPLDELHHPCSPSVAIEACSDASAAAVQLPQPREGPAGVAGQASVSAAGEACEAADEGGIWQPQMKNPSTLHGKGPACEATDEEATQNEGQPGKPGAVEKENPAAETLPVEASAAVIHNAGSTAAPSLKQKRVSKKDKKKKASQKLAEEGTGEAPAMDLKRVWWRSCDRTLVIHHEPTVAEVAKLAMSRLVSKEVEYRSKGARKGGTSKSQDPAQSIQSMQSPTEAAMFRIVGAACYWRTAVAHFVDISPVMVLPDTLVNYILKHRPRGTLEVVRCMHRWVRSHQAKHAERFKLEAAAAAAASAATEGNNGTGGGVSVPGAGSGHDRNPFAWYLDHWTPGWATVIASPWLAWLLHCAYTGKTSLLPVQVERMIAQQEVKHQRPSASNGQAAASKGSQRNQTASQTSSQPRNEKGAAKSSGQAAHSSNEGHESAPKGGAAAQMMMRDKIIGKFSKKKPAYSSCRMLSQDGEFLAACDLKKLVWYVNKGLGQWEPDLGPQSSQPTIRLTFQHRTTDQDSGDAFYNEVKANECVGCGEAGHYLKYKIVPDCYRKHFPVNMKSHRSHDIVLLCIDCHEKAHTSAEALKRHLAAFSGVPLQPTSMPIRSDPFLPTPPPEECCSSRDGDGEQDADSLSDATASAADYQSGAALDATASIVASAASADRRSDAPNATAASAGDCRLGTADMTTAADAAALGDSTSHIATAAPAVDVQKQPPVHSEDSAAAPTSAESTESSPIPVKALQPALGCDSRPSQDGATECAAANTLEASEAAGFNESLAPQSRGGNKDSAAVASAMCSSAGEVPADVVSQRMPSPAHVRRVALTLERQPNLPDERRKDLEAVVTRYVHGPAAPTGLGLAPGDLEAALLAGLAKSKRNSAIARLMQAGRPAPSGYTLSQQDGRVSVISAPHHQGGHMWHGRKVVEKIMATYGKAGLQELQVEFRKRFVAAVQPNNLPTSWKIHHEAPREFGMHSIFNSETSEPPSIQPPQIFALSSRQAEGVFAARQETPES